MHERHVRTAAVGLALSLAGWAPLLAQGRLPLEPQRPAGLAVSPVYEGWYRNPDGGYILSFGYINRNTEEVLEVPAGPRNRLEGGEPSGHGLPTRFLPRRHYGVFTVRVPADFGRDDEVVWTLNVRGQTFSIPGRLNPLYQIDALGAPATGHEPPRLRFGPDGPETRGPHGVIAAPLETRVGEPLELVAWVHDQDEGEEDEDEHPALWWYEWSGPGDVVFGEAEVRADEATGRAVTTATFSAPGDYVLYVRTNVSDDGESGHEQCCWTNGYVKVTVTR